MLRRLSVLPLALFLLLLAPAASAIAADGLGTATITPTYVINSSTGNFFTITYTAGAGGITNGQLKLIVPAGWPAPNADGFGAGGSNAMCGDFMPAMVGQTMTVNDVTLPAGNTCDIHYGINGFGTVTATSSVGPATFTIQEKSTAVGTLTDLIAGSPQVNVGTDGTGTMTVSPVESRVSSVGNTLTFHYTATRTMTSGKLTLAVPAGWSAPSTTTSNPGYVTTNCSGGTVGVAGSTITVDTITITSGTGCDIVYGSKASGGPGATAPSTSGTLTFTTQQQSSSTPNLLAIGVSPTEATIAPDGSGTLTSSISSATTSQSNLAIALTYTAATGGMAHGQLKLTVPAGWTPPNADGFAAGGSNAMCGDFMPVMVGQTMTINDVTLADGATCTINYGISGFGTVTAPAAQGLSTFILQEKSGVGGALTAIASPPTIQVGDDGTGTITRSPIETRVASTGNTITFTYTAGRNMTAGALAIAVPAGWSAPSTTATAAGFTSTTCSGGSVGAVGQTINVTGINMASAATCTVTYGSTASGGPGATAPATGGTGTFTTQQKSSVGGTLINLLTGSPTVAIVSLDGSGTLTSSRSQVVTSMSNLAIAFTYTAATGGLTHGQLKLTVPAGWTPPNADGFAAGGSNAMCGDFMPVMVGQTMTINDVTLADGATCTINYGITGFGTVTSPSSPGVGTFTLQEKSGSGGSLAAIALSPSIIVGDDGTGTITGSLPTTLAASTGNTVVLTYTAEATMSAGALAIAVPAGWSAPSTTASAAGFTSTTCPGGTVGVAGTTINVTGINLASAASCTVTYGSTASGGPGATAPAGGGTGTFTTQHKGAVAGTLTNLSSSPSIDVVAADGSGTVSLSPTTVLPNASGLALTFTYTAGAGGMTHGQLKLTVPAGWTPPNSDGFAAGGSNALCGDFAPVMAGQTMTINDVTIPGGGTCQLHYGIAGFGTVTSPNSIGIASFTLQQKSRVSGALTALASQPSLVIGNDGSGTMSVAPQATSASSTGNTLTFTYTSVGGISSGEVAVDIPAGWSAPSTTGTAAGFTTSTCGTVAVVGGAIHVTGVTLANAGTCTITYGATSSGGPGATAPAATGSSAYAVQSLGGAGGALLALTAGSPSSTVFAADGTGTLTADTSAVAPGAPGTTVVLTYTAAAGGMSSGTIDINVPAGWTPPSTTSSNAGFTTSTCASVAIVSGAVHIAGVTLAGGSTCTITYGSKASGGTGADVPATPGSATFAGHQRSTGGGVLTALAVSPGIDITSVDGSGTLSTTPASVVESSTGNTFVLTYTAAAGGLVGGGLAIAVPAALPVPSTTGTDAGFTTSNCGSVAVASGTIQVTSITLAGGATCTITYGSKASGGPGVTAPVAGSYTLATQQRSMASGVLTNLAASSMLTVTAVPVPPKTPETSFTVLDTVITTTNSDKPLPGSVGSATACDEGCTVTSRFYITAALAKKLGLLNKRSKSKALFLVGSGSRTRPAADIFLVHTKLTTRAKLAFRGQRSIKITQIVTISGASGKVTRTRQLTLVSHTA